MSSIENSVSETAGMLTTVDVARKLGVSRDTVHNYVARGLLVPDFIYPESKYGASGSRRYKPETIDAFLRSCATSEYTGERLLSTGEVAFMLGVNIRTVTYHISTGKLKPDMVLPEAFNGRSGARRFKRGTVDAFLAERALKGRKAI